MSTTVIKKQWINGLDSIRFVLAFVVMMGHLHGKATLSPGPHNFIVKLISHIHPVYCGPAAVITFFVLSGFVIHYPNRNKESFDIVGFLIRRVLRIGVPLLIIGVFANYIGLLRSLPVWSLYCEIIYYFVYPFLFKLKISWKKQFLFTFILSYIIIIGFNFDTVLSFIHQRDINYKLEYWQMGTWVTALIGLPCWLAGVLLASRIDDINYTVSFTKLMICRILVYLISAFLLIGTFHFYFSYLYTLNVFSVIAVKWIEMEIIYYRNHKTSKVLEYMGKFSYTLYLCHPLIYVFLFKFFKYGYSTIPIFIIFTICLAYVIYLLIEYPSHKLAQYLSTAYKKRFVDGKTV